MRMLKSGVRIKKGRRLLNWRLPLLSPQPSLKLPTPLFFGIFPHLLIGFSCCSVSLSLILLCVSPHSLSFLTISVSHSTYAALSPSSVALSSTQPHALLCEYLASLPPLFLPTCRTDHSLYVETGRRQFRPLLYPKPRLTTLCSNFCRDYRAHKKMKGNKKIKIKRKRKKRRMRLGLIFRFLLLSLCSVFISKQRLASFLRFRTPPLLHHFSPPFCCCCACAVRSPSIT
uniref:Transmembrane protein n=1 Tax=Trypanosoma vivax (strain Y486) TaxID=1055687 RepID=G0UAE7_TRYVY|nr:hypothetical protein TVY486_1102650 [Trypanosoma vivax Y486]